MTPEERAAIRAARARSPRTVLGRRDIETAGFDTYEERYVMVRTPRSLHRTFGREPKI